MGKDDFNPRVHPELLIKPVQLFGNYYFADNKLVGFHALKTSKDLLLFDATDGYNTNDMF